MTAEFLTLQIGKFGIQTGHEFWKNIYQDHSLQPDGKEILKKTNIFERKEIFLKEKIGGFFTPRAILVDLEPRVLYRLMKGNYKNFYEKKNILFSNQSAGNNWANGYYRSLEFQTEIEENLRKSSENCNNLGFFNIFSSISGGTGGGTGSYALELIRDEFPGKLVNSYTLIPNGAGAFDSVVQPYNSILSFRWLKLYSDCVTLFENAAIEKIINSYNHKIGPNFREINYLIARMVSVSTENIRFPSNQKQTWESSIASLIPTPNLHFLVGSILDIDFFSEKKTKFSSNFCSNKKNLENKTVSFPLKFGKAISSLHFIRNDMNESDSFCFFKKILKKDKPDNISWKIHPFNVVDLKYSNKSEYSERKISFFNHTNVRHLFSETKGQYDVLRKRNAFLNSYLQNFPSNDGLDLFEEARESIQSLIEEYEWADKSQFF